jgi:hypothetical protein
MLGPSHWLHEISLPKRVLCHFWLGLTPLAKNTLSIGNRIWGKDSLKHKPSQSPNFPWFTTILYDHFVKEANYCLPSSERYLLK